MVGFFFWDGVEAVGLPWRASRAAVSLPISAVRAAAISLVSMPGIITLWAALRAPYIF